jgi:hypothetical protein
MSLFNPWVLLGIVLAVLSSFGGGYYKGKQAEHDRQQLEIAALNAQARTKEQALAVAVNTTADELRKTNEKAKTVAKERDAAITSGAYRLRVAVKAPVCPVHAAPDTPAPAGDSPREARAELDPEVGKALFAIAEEGDRAIAKLNACVELYNKAREAQK